MKGILLALNHACIFFGATLYCGVLWSLRFFWFPTWRHLTVANYYDQFTPETLAATRFFTVVVPIMFFCCLVMIVTEWRGKLRWAAVNAAGFMRSPEAVLECRAYQEARPHSAAAEEAVEAPAVRPAAIVTATSAVRLVFFIF